MKKKFQVKPEDYGFPSKIGGMTIKTISWRDFPAKAPQNTWFLAYTYWNTNWTSTMKGGKGSVLATVAIGPRAWTRAEDDFQLLEHQTGHYWIACLCALQFQKRVNYTEVKSDGMNFQEWSQKIFKTTSYQYAQEQKRYDKETHHYLIEDEQKRWKREMIQKFNQYNQFFEQKKREQQKNDALLAKVISRQMCRNPPLNSINRVMKSVPIQKKLPSVSVGQTKPVVNPPSTNPAQVRRQNRQFSVRRTNTIFNQRDVNKNVKVFELAKNSLLGNILLMEGLK